MSGSTAWTGALNLKPVDDEALAALMPQILPKAWKSAGVNGMLSGASPVEWSPPPAEVGDGLSFGDGFKSGGGGEGHPSVEMLALLWRRLAAVSPGSLVGPGRCCSPCHRMPFNSRNEGAKRVG